MILSAAEVKERANKRIRGQEKQKSVLERKGTPTFPILVEVLGWQDWRIHLNVGQSVDDLLAGRKPCTQRRWIKNGKMMMNVSSGNGNIIRMGAQTYTGWLQEIRESVDWNK